MAKRQRSKNEAFHDRYASIYDSRYTGNPYWEVYDAVTWAHMRRFLPADLSTRVLDAGCGTGKWGLRLAKSGYRVTLSDLSQKMLDQAANKAEQMGVADRVELCKADLATLEGLPDAAFDFIVAQGDPLSLVDKPQQAMKAVARVAAPAGIVVASVDNRWAGVDHYLERGDLRELDRFLKAGQSQWHGNREESRFPLHMFWPRELCAGLEAQSFEVLDVLGKTVLVTRHTDLSLYNSPAAQKRLVQLELRYGREREALGRAAHLQIAARRRP